MSQPPEPAGDEQAPADGANPIAPLGREEYVEQAHFFRSLGQRLRENVPMQEVLESVREEVLATTKLPLAIDFLLAELRHTGAMGAAMAKLPHYFSPLQAYLVQAGEDERGRFDMRVGLEILRREAEFRAGPPVTGLPGGGPMPNRQGLFLFEFEAVCRNRLSYDRGLGAMAADPSFDSDWQAWISALRRQVGMVDLADLIYVSSEHYHSRLRRAKQPAGAEATVVLFGEREGRIALANRRKDPLVLFNAFHRHLGYTAPPRTEQVDEEEALLPQLARRVEQIEKRMKLLEEEQRGGIDLTKFYGPQSE
ncbi:MAG: hypothetical protein AAGB00_08090 [Planctomycetota bacterium]